MRKTTSPWLSRTPWLVQDHSSQVGVLVANLLNFFCTYPWVEDCTMAVPESTSKFVILSGLFVLVTHSAGLHEVSLQTGLSFKYIHIRPNRFLPRQLKSESIETTLTSRLFFFRDFLLRDYSTMYYLPGFCPPSLRQLSAEGRAIRTADLSQRLGAESLASLSLRHNILSTMATSTKMTTSSSDAGLWLFPVQLPCPSTRK